VTCERVEIAAGGATLVGDHWNGAGATIALLHAGVCDRRCWREVGARLSAAGRDVVAYDRRGFGDVAPAAGPFRHVDDLLAVLDAVSPDAPVWLVGSSRGGQLALDAALEAPERVAGLVLLAPGPAGPEGRVSGPPRELALDMNRIVIANGEPDADGASGLDAASRLHELAIQAIVACGELDVAIEIRRSSELADALPNATYRSLAGRAHLPYLEAPDEIAALVMAEADYPTASVVT
jgi:pimeloyl-ACP methyl ester carboxylesterase